MAAATHPAGKTCRVDGKNTLKTAPTPPAATHPSPIRIMNGLEVFIAHAGMDR